MVGRCGVFLLGVSGSWLKLVIVVGVYSLELGAKLKLVCTPILGSICTLNPNFVFQVCYGGSLLTETFSIHVVSHDGNVGIVDMKADRSARRGEVWPGKVGPDV